MQFRTAAPILVAFVFSLSLALPSSGHQASNPAEATTEKRIEKGAKIYVAPH